MGCGSFCGSIKTSDVIMQSVTTETNITQQRLYQQFPSTNTSGVPLKGYMYVPVYSKQGRDKAVFGTKKSTP